MRKIHPGDFISAIGSVRAGKDGGHADKGISGICTLAYTYVQ